MTDYRLVPVEPTAEMLKAAACSVTHPENLPPIGEGWSMNDLAFRTRYQAALAAAPDVHGEPLRYTNDGALAECPCCGSLDVGGAHDTVHCYSCDLTVTNPRPLQNAIDAWNTRTGRTHPAPAVQGEPVATVEVMPDGSQVWIALKTQWLPVGLHKLYTAPQPAEQQPLKSSLALEAATHLTNWLEMDICECEGGHYCGYNEVKRTRDALLEAAEQHPCPEDIREGAPYDDPAFESLCREHEIWGTAAAAQCSVFWEAGKRAAEQQAATDVAGLVEALEDIGASWHRAGTRLEKYLQARARNALAAHRKQGGEK